MMKVRSFAKINVGLCIGNARADGFHELLTVYQTVALHDVLGVDLARGSAIEIRSADLRVPTDQTNTCYKIAERFLSAAGTKRGVTIEIQKQLPIQGGLGGASSNAVAVLLALERLAKRFLPASERLRIAAEVGSDLPLFLVGGTTLGVGRGECVYPLPDMPETDCVIVAPGIGVSTPQAFRDWDDRQSASFGSANASEGFARGKAGPLQISPRKASTGGRHAGAGKLTLPSTSYRMDEFSRKLSSWLSGYSGHSRKPTAGVPATGRGRAENPLLDLVHTGIENDFEQVVFPKYPELREIKQAMLRAGAVYASLSGSGSALYGLFQTGRLAQTCAARLQKQGISAAATTTLTRQQYWKKFLVSGF